MRKRGRIVLAAAIIVIAGGFAWWVLTPPPPVLPDPVYDGHPLSKWVDGSVQSRVTGIKIIVPTPDTNALPYLIHALRTRDGLLRGTYNQLWPHFPVGLQSHLAQPNYTAGSRVRATFLLSNMKTNAQPAIPDLIRVLRKDDANGVRMNAAWALGWIANHDDPAVLAALAAATKDPDPSVSRMAGDAFAYLAPAAAAKAGITSTNQYWW